MLPFPNSSSMGEAVTDRRPGISSVAFPLTFILSREGRGNVGGATTRRSNLFPSPPAGKGAVRCSRIEVGCDRRARRWFVRMITEALAGLAVPPYQGRSSAHWREACGFIDPSRAAHLPSPPAGEGRVRGMRKAEHRTSNAQHSTLNSQLSLTAKTPSSPNNSSLIIHPSSFRFRVMGKVFRACCPNRKRTPRTASLPKTTVLYQAFWEGRRTRRPLLLRRLALGNTPFTLR